MKNKSFKTNITCSGCIGKVTPFLNEIAGEGNWDVNLRTKTKTLTISETGIDEGVLAEGLKKLGYVAVELVNPETENK